jgi:hypothetical protein
MIEFTSKDRMFLRALWPWGLLYVLAILSSIVISWLAGGRNDWATSVGSIFFVLLLAPFAWYGLAEYFDWLIFRGIESSRASLLAVIYLSTPAIKFVFSYGTASSWNIPIGCLLGLIVTLLWMQYRRTQSGLPDSSSIDLPKNLRWLADLTMFLVIALLAFAL